MIPPNVKDLTGRRFHMLTVTGYVGTRDRHAYWECSCDCGAENVLVRGSKLMSGAYISCGCWSRNIAVRVYKRFGIPDERREEIARLGYEESNASLRERYSVRLKENK